MWWERGDISVRGVQVIHLLNFFLDASYLITRVPESSERERELTLSFAFSTFSAPGEKKYLSAFSTRFVDYLIQEKVSSAAV
jgi:hypothetical protein